MADLVITAANVVSQPGSSIDRDGYAGEAVAAGKPVYKDPATGRWLLADNNSATTKARVPGGIALNGAGIGQPLAVHRSGDIVIGATLTPGTDYWLSDTPGGICPRADLATGETACMIGVAKSATVLAVDISASGVTL